MKKYHIYLSILITVHFLLFFFTGLFRHWGFLTSINELAHFDQAVWGTINGHFLLNTDVFSIPTSRLAMHFDPIQLIFVPFYLIYPSVVWLIGGQSFSIAITALPLYILAKRILNSEKLGFFWALIYLLNPFILNAAGCDFHAITLALPLIGLAMLAVVMRNFFLIILVSILTLFCKEHLGIMVAGFGLLWCFRNKEYKKGVILIFIGMTFFFTTMKMIIPYFSPTGENIMIKGGNLGEGFSRYGWLGGNLQEVFATVFKKNIKILKIVLFDLDGAAYIILLLLPFLGFSIMGIIFLIPGAGDILANILSSGNYHKSFYSYHSATLIPVLCTAAIYGVRVIEKYLKSISISQITGLVLLSSTILGYWAAPFPLPGSANFWEPKNFIMWPDSRINRIKSIIKNDQAISVQGNVGAYFSQRKEIYSFPNKIEEVDSIILWLKSPTENIPKRNKLNNEINRLSIGTLDSHLRMERYEYLNKVKNLLNDGKFHVAYWDDPWLVLKKKADGNMENILFDIERKIEILKKEWK